MLRTGTRSPVILFSNVASRGDREKTIDLFGAENAEKSLFFQRVKMST
jgi:hypothetical protein